MSSNNEENQTDKKEIDELEEDYYAILNLSKDVNKEWFLNKREWIEYILYRIGARKRYNTGIPSFWSHIPSR